MTISYAPSSRLSNTEIQNLLHDHNLGDLRYTKSISKGVSHQVYSIRTNTNSYILYLFEEPILDLAFIQKASIYFTDKGFPFSKILAIGEIAKKTAILMSALPGKPKSDWDEMTYETIGFFLGNFHLCSSSFVSDTSPNIPFIWQLSHHFSELQPHIPQEFRSLEQEIFALEETWPLDLPKGFIHSDIWHNNILFTNNSISGVLNFSPSYEPFILDLANIIKGIPSSNQTFLPALLSGYELARPLSFSELNSLDLLVHGKTINTILCLLKQAIDNPLRKDEFQTYAFLNLLKL